MLFTSYPSGRSFRGQRTQHTKLITLHFMRGRGISNYVAHETMKGSSTPLPPLMTMSGSTQRRKLNWIEGARRRLGSLTTGTTCGVLIRTVEYGHGTLCMLSWCTASFVQPASMHPEQQLAPLTHRSQPRANQGQDTHLSWWRGFGVRLCARKQLSIRYELYCLFCLRCGVAPTSRCSRWSALRSWKWWPWGWWPWGRWLWGWPAPQEPPASPGWG